MTFNARRGLLGAISVGGEIAYHLFGIEHRGHNSISSQVKLLRKSKWPAEYSANGKP